MVVHDKSLTIFEGQKVRRIWNKKEERWYFSVIDIIALLTEQRNYNRAKTYWTTLKNRLKNEGSEVVTKCDRLKLLAQDGKMRETDVANVETILRLIQSVPSKKTEPIKLWLAKVVEKTFYRQQKLINCCNLAFWRRFLSSRLSPGADHVLNLASIFPSGSNKGLFSKVS